MPLLAINVALIFPLVAPLKSANRHLLSLNPDGFEFNVDHKPHVTLLQDFIENCPKNINKLAATLTKVISQAEPIDKVCFSALSAPPGLSPSLIISDPHDKIRDLHIAITQASAPFSIDASTYTTLNHAFFTPPNPSGLSHTINYRTEHAFEHYDPHLTLGKARDINLCQLSAFFTFPLQLAPQGIVLAQLGRSGTVSDNILARW